MVETHDIKPSLTSQDIVCAETPVPPCGMVVFGASGDLTARKLLVSLAQLFAQDLLNEHFFLLGCGRTNYSDTEFRNIAQQSLRENAGGLSISAIQSFVRKLYYISGDYSESEEKTDKREEKSSKKDASKADNKDKGGDQ